MSISKRLFETLDKSGMRSIDLADKLGVDPAVLSNWKRRDTDPPAKFIIPICETLHISIHWLLTGIDDVERAAAQVAASLPPDEEKALRYYRRLDEEGKDYIKGKMVDWYTEKINEERSETKSEDIV